MSNEVEASVAYAALNTPARRTFATIVAAIERNGGGEVALSSAAIMEAQSTSSTSHMAASTRTLAALGLVAVTTGHRGVSVYAKSDGWRAVVDPDEAKRIVLAAREPIRRKPASRPQVRARKPVTERVAEPEAEPEQRQGPRPISLAQIPWPTEVGLRLLAEDGLGR